MSIRRTFSVAAVAATLAGAALIAAPAAQAAPAVPSAPAAPAAARSVWLNYGSYYSATNCHYTGQALVRVGHALEYSCGSAPDYELWVRRG
ncbi:hypothetical protein [Streptomyces sp. NPDC005955]|uniref:hypothetical protein n=1 Tax=Streptomyces sp. NPDC005955 TaxID=3364738 RepID=UPI0036A1AFB0